MKHMANLLTSPLGISTGLTLALFFCIFVFSKNIYKKGNNLKKYLISISN